MKPISEWTDDELWQRAERDPAHAVVSELAAEVLWLRQMWRRDLDGYQSLERVLRERAEKAETDLAAAREQIDREIAERDKETLRAERLERSVPRIGPAVRAGWDELVQRAKKAEADLAAARAEIERYRAGAEGARLDRWMAKEAELLDRLAAQAPVVEAAMTYRDQHHPSAHVVMDLNAAVDAYRAAQQDDSDVSD